MSLEISNIEPKKEKPAKSLGAGSEVMVSTEEGTLDPGWKIFHVFDKDDEEVKDGKAQEGDFLVIKGIGERVLRKKVSPGEIKEQLK